MSEKKSVLGGFKDFISRGNVIDMAVGIVIGGAFTPIITAVVEKVINPLIAGIFGKPNFDSLLVIHLGKAEVMPGAVLTAVVNFLLVAAALYFCVVVPMNKMAEAEKKRHQKDTAEPEPEPEPEPTKEEILLGEIRDLLQQKQQ